MEEIREEPVPVKKKRKPRVSKTMARVLGLKQLFQMVHKPLPNLPEDIRRSFGDLEHGFRMLVWGPRKNGKSNLVVQFVKAMTEYGKVLYVSLEEGFRGTTQRTMRRHLNEDDHNGKIEFANHLMTFEALREKLRKRKSPMFIVIDSVQYWRITKAQYDELMVEFPKKSFIFISHAIGKNPKGALALDISHDVDVVVRVEGCLGFVESRFEGNAPYIIEPTRAKRYWGRKYKKMSTEGTI